jgi:phosphohistidine phosphatase
MGKTVSKTAHGDRLIYLVRHGRAEDSHPLGDHARGLTAEGRRAFQHLLGQVASKLDLQGVVSSPLVRAVQTAELLARACAADEVLIRENLAYEQASGAGVIALARGLGPGWALVGHNPSMGEALSLALGLGSEPTRFRKGAIAALEPSEKDQPWKLRWVISPGRDFESSF